MKRCLGLVIFSLALFNKAYADVTSHTFFSVRPQFQSGSPEKETLFHAYNHIEDREDGWGSAWQFVPLGGKSTKSDDIARYFLPFGKSCILIAENGAPLAANRDIDASNLNIETLTDSYQATVCFCPTQKVVGCGFTWKQALWYNCNDELKWWFEVSFPVVKVSNNVGFKEDIIDNMDGGTAVNATGLDNAPRVANAAQAFAQSNWKYGRIIAGRDMSKTGVADVELKLWYNTVLGDCCHTSWFAGVVAPTGNKPKAEYVFEPIVGNNHHVGILYGTSIGFEDIWVCGNHSFSTALDIASRYLFSNCQTRSFDLDDRSWGRYMETYASQDDALAAAATGSSRSGTSGINVFTQQVKVAPRFSTDVTSSFIYRHCNFVAEAGVNLFVRQAEKITPQCDQNATATIKYAGGLGDTSRARTIRYQFLEEIVPVAEYAALPLAEYNYESAAHPAVITHTIFGTMGYNFSSWCIPTFIGVGGSYEFTHSNTGMHRWLVWGKLGISF